MSELILRLTGEKISIQDEKNETGGNSMEKFFEPMIERAKAKARIEALSEGMAAGEAKGENSLARLIGLLLSEGKNDKIKEVVENEDIRHGLYKEYGIQ